MDWISFLTIPEVTPGCPQSRHHFLTAEVVASSWESYSAPGPGPAPEISPLPRCCNFSSVKKPFKNPKDALLALKQVYPADWIQGSNTIQYPLAPIHFVLNPIRSTTQERPVYQFGHRSERHCACHKYSLVNAIRLQVVDTCLGGAYTPGIMAIGELQSKAKIRKQTKSWIRSFGEHSLWCYKLVWDFLLYTNSTLFVWLPLYSKPSWLNNLSLV